MAPVAPRARDALSAANELDGDLGHTPKHGVRHAKAAEHKRGVLEPVLGDGHKATHNWGVSCAALGSNGRCMLVH